MKATARVIQFPTMQRIKKQSQRKAPATRSMDGIKYFSESQIKLLRKAVRDASIADESKGLCTGVREWACIDLLTSTGLRVSEAADVRCGDLRASYGESALYVRNGKGQRSRTVQIPDSLKLHIKRYIAWKAERGEATGPDDHLFMGQRGPWTSQAVQQVVKKYLKALGLYDSGKSVHALRHSYATALQAGTRSEGVTEATGPCLGHDHNDICRCLHRGHSGAGQRYVG